MNVNGKYITVNEYKTTLLDGTAGDGIVGFKLVFFRLNRELNLVKIEPGK